MEFLVKNNKFLSYVKQITSDKNDLTSLFRNISTTYLLFAKNLVTHKLFRKYTYNKNRSML